MATENNSSNGQGDIAQFLEKFQDPNLNTFNFTPTAAREDVASEDVSNQYAHSFEKLEQKVQELEEKFDVSERQNEKIMAELAHTREHLERQKDRDAFIQHLSFSIANLRASVENLSRAQQERPFSWREPDVQRSFDTVSRPVNHAPIYQYEPDAYREVQERRRQEEQAEKERIISSLHQKASQLKAVNSALDREIKKVQQEKMEALKKSAEQAKEILSLRDQLNKAEEKFKSFDFEGRIVSIRQEYEQRVNSLETQLKEISDTCMKQVEEIETLRTENIKLHEAAAEKEQLLIQLEEKEKELQSLREEIASLQENSSLQSQNQQAIYAETVRSLETQRDELTVQLQATQNELDAVRSEKDQLEQNFKALVEKINGNDAVIEQLKQKIEVLGTQNEQLAQQNTQLNDKQTQLFEKNEQLAFQNTQLTEKQAQLFAQNEQLAQQSSQLTKKQAELFEKNEQLAFQNTQLTQKQALLFEQNEQLARQNDDLTHRQEKLFEKNEQLSQQNRQLSTRQAQLEQQLLDAHQTPSVIPVVMPVKQAQNTQASNAQPEKPVAKPAPAAPQNTSAKSVPPAPSAQIPTVKEHEESPMEITQTATPKVQTSADLPEIKVADPVQTDPDLSEGEDFLEKTDNFIGRIKWSIFNEDR